MTAPPSAIRVFLGASGRDFRGERTFLHRVFLPMVRWQWERQGLTLEVVDPGWDARAQRPAPDEAAEGGDAWDALNLVDATRPYSLWWLGDRYGQGFQKLPASLARAYPWVAACSKGVSRFHLELKHAALTGLPSRHAALYRRHLQPATDDPRTLPDDPRAARNLARLLGELQGSPLAHRSYAATWDADAGVAAGVEGLRDLLLGDLTRIVQETLPTFPELTWEEEPYATVWAAPPLAGAPMIASPPPPASVPEPAPAAIDLPALSVSAVVPAPAAPPASSLRPRTMLEVDLPATEAALPPTEAALPPTPAPAPAPPPAPAPAPPAPAASAQWPAGARLSMTWPRTVEPGWWYDLDWVLNLGPPREQVPAGVRVRVIPQLPGGTFDPPQLELTWDAPLIRGRVRFSVGHRQDGRTLKGVAHLLLGPVPLGELPWTLKVQSDSDPFGAGGRIEEVARPPHAQVYLCHDPADPALQALLPPLTRCLPADLLRRTPQPPQPGALAALLLSGRSARQPDCLRSWEAALNRYPAGPLRIVLMESGVAVPPEWQQVEVIPLAAAPTPAPPASLPPTAPAAAAPPPVRETPYAEPVAWSEPLLEPPPAPRPPAKATPAANPPPAIQMISEAEFERGYTAMGVRAGGDADWPSLPPSPPARPAEPHLQSTAIPGIAPQPPDTGSFHPAPGVGTPALPPLRTPPLPPVMARGARRPHVARPPSSSVPLWLIAGSVVLLLAGLVALVLLLRRT